MIDPSIIAERMEAADRRRGIEHGDSCLTCSNRETLWGEAFCLRGHKMTRRQFHKCGKKGDYFRCES